MINQIFRVFRLYWPGERWLLMLLSFFSIALIGGALYLQIFQHEEPCPLCILQRYAYLLIALLALIGAVVPSRRIMLIIEVFLLVVAAGGIAAAIHHIWVLTHPFLGCGFDALQPIIDRLPFAKILPIVFKVGGLCETSNPLILGLTLPGWSLIGYLMIFMLISYSLWQRTPSHCNA